MDTEMREKVPEAKQVDRMLVVDCISQNYDLTITDILPLSGGTENAAWIIEAAPGKWVAKIFGSDEGPTKRIEEEIRLYHFLNKHGINAPEVLSNKAGKGLSSIRFDKKELTVMLMKYEQLSMCSPSTITREELELIAGETAKMHKAMESYPGAISLKKTGRATHKRGAAFEALASSVHKKAFTAGGLRQLQETDERIEEYLAIHQPTKPLTESVIHADLSLEHAQLLPGGGVYFFDFSDRKWGPVAEELGTFLTAIFQWEDISTQRWDELSTWILESYQKKSKLTEDDISAINFFILARILGACKYLIDLTKDSPNEIVVAWIKRGYVLGERILDKL